MEREYTISDDYERLETLLSSLEWSDGQRKLWEAERDWIIYHLHLAGVAAQGLAADIGISRQRIHQIINQRAEIAQQLNHNTAPS